MKELFSDGSRWKKVEDGNTEVLVENEDSGEVQWVSIVDWKDSDIYRKLEE